MGHCDAEAFYVSAERVRNRFLVGKPVGILGNQGACVIARSKEMKAAGVTTAMPIWDALTLCPDGIYIKRDFRWYEVLSTKMLECVREMFARVEYYSIDECFFDAIPLPGMDLQQTAEAVRDQIMERVGVPVRVGIARTRTLAKLISDSAGSGGARALLDDDSVAPLLASLPVTEITGIAGRRAKRLSVFNIQTCLDFADADRQLIRQALNNVNGEALWAEIRGEPAFPLHPSRPLHKMLSRGGSFGEASASPIILWAWLVRNLERLIEELEYHQVCAGKLTVWVGYRHGESRASSTTLAAPSQRFDILLDAARPCLRRAWIPRAWANRMHLIAENLTHRDRVQRGLFEPVSNSTRAEAVAKLKREVNRRHGRFILRSGATLPLPEIYRDPANGYDICDIRGKSCF